MTTQTQPAKASGEFAIGGKLPVTRLGFIPWFPLATGELAKPGTPLAQLAAERGASPSQLALAWLLHRSPAMLPIPGTSTVAHLEDNIAAADIKLSDSEYAALEAAVR